MTHLVAFEGDRMRPLSTAKGLPAGSESHWARHRWWLLGTSSFVLAFAGLFMAGCQKPAPPPTSVLAPQNTPQSKLDWVVKRLERAFELGRPSRLAGIRVQHTMSYQFREPSEPTGDYQATVVIRTRTENTLSPKRDPPKRDRDGGAGQASALDPMGIQDQATSFQDANRPKSVEGDTISLSQQGSTSNPTAESSGAHNINTHTIQDQQAFELVYRSDRWQLVQELDSDPERLWFQYALQP
jgi:hypothetical protein